MAYAIIMGLSFNALEHMKEFTSAFEVIERDDGVGLLS